MPNNGKAKRQALVDLSTLTSDRRQRILKIEGMLLRGITSPNTIAAAFDVSHTQIWKDIKLIQAMWAESQDGSRKATRNKRIRQLESVLHMALTEFDKSRNSKSETTTVQRKTICRSCNGRGTIRVDGDDANPCPACETRGWQIEEITTEKRSGVTGDQSYLNTARACINDISKLEGLQVQVTHKKIDKKEQKIVLHSELIPEKDPNNPYMNANPEDLIELRKAQAKIEQSLILEVDNVSKESEEKDKDSDV